MFVSKAMRVFITLYQEKNLKSAADKLYLTVPPVSRMLKLTEDWIGEKLFIIERNRIIPTHVAECIYYRLLPHYCALEYINKQPSERHFRLSSPQSNTFLLTDLLQPCLSTLPTPPFVRFAESIRDDDDIFISFHPITVPVCFEVTRTDLVLSLRCCTSLLQNWHKKTLLTEQSMMHLPDFQKALIRLRKQGFTGQLRQIDNPVWLKTAFIAGEGLLFQLSTSVSDEFSTLPFIYHQPLYIYMNSPRKNNYHEDFLINIKNILC